MFIHSFLFVIGQGLLLVALTFSHGSLACSWAEQSMTGACNGLLDRAEMVNAEGAQEGRMSTIQGMTCLCLVTSLVTNLV